MKKKEKFGKERRKIHNVAAEFNASIDTFESIVHDQPAWFFADGFRNLPNQ